MNTAQKHNLLGDGAQVLRILTQVIPQLLPHRSLSDIVGDIQHALGSSVTWIAVERDGELQVNHSGEGSDCYAQACQVLMHPRIIDHPYAWRILSWPHSVGDLFYPDEEAHLRELQTGILCKLSLRDYGSTAWLFLAYQHTLPSITILKHGVTILADKLRDYLLEQSARQFAFHELQHISEQYKILFERAPVLMNSFDRNGRCTLWNGECERVFGWTIDEINQAEDPLALFYPDPAIRSEVRESINTSPLTAMKEWHPLRRDGSILTTLWANILLPDNSVLNIGLDITARKQAERILTLKATIDDLTQCLNRSEILNKLERELDTTPETRFAVLMIDLDYFKRINDSWGHAAGDKALLHFCDCIRACRFPEFYVGRLGGEEFLVILKNADCDNAVDFTVQLRERLISSPLLINEEPVALSFSAGAIAVTSGELPLSHVLTEADKALYQAKHTGRSRTVCAQPGKMC
ncbi:sensor domain-containing diguanylate cyclase [Atlantibacter sp.]|uniref:GGDEF domain-containing protein n=1 Tax=Atlantibacter sp. TaxID=1903473 RepID=UPI0028ABD24E|nr:sensor domain-containing diguanylate cyclase [Atlantibacter sp.]